ncbi:hypothetical protein ACFT25_38060 [Streptomyces hydrogenans]|uniref:hypothetical protein n=1 Tax=Streptomyces hydrogenans TaxID=1873719 RepID=UPI00362E3A37
MSDRIEHVRLPRMAETAVFMAGPEGLALIDLIAVERAVTGHRDGARLTKDEAHYAADLLLAADVAVTLVASLVGVGVNTLKVWFPERTKSVRLDPPKCGTRRGYLAHKRRGDAICRRCRTANAVADLHYKRTGSYDGAPAVAA